MGAVGTHHLDDRADVADFAVIAVIAFDRLHLLGHYPADLALVERHLGSSLLGRGEKAEWRLYVTAITHADISVRYIRGEMEQLSPTAYVILGMVLGEPRSGYEIKAVVDRST